MHNIFTCSSKQNIWRWLLLVVCLATIWYFSNQTFKQQDLRPKIREYTGLVHIVQAMPRIHFDYDGNHKPTDNRKDPVNFIHFWIRKGAHVIMYGILGLSLLLVLGRYIRTERTRYLAAGFGVTLVAGFDEFNQTFVGDRTGMFRDVLVDLAGFILFALAFYLAKRFIILRKTKPSAQGLVPASNT
ncbi:MAG TPA: VanZ family protein [Candidatus Aquicultor sp.]|jgi:VanZ family protein